MSYRYKKSKLTLTALEKTIKEYSEYLSFHKESLKKYQREINEFIPLTPSESESAKSVKVELMSAINSYLKMGGAGSFPEPLSIQLMGRFSGNAEWYNGKYYNKNQLRTFFLIESLSKNDSYKRYERIIDLNKRVKDAVNSIKSWESHIAEYEKKALPLRKKKDSLLELKARAAENAQATRIVAETVKRKLSPTEYCPYCENLLDANYHVDHIHPVSKGGLSVPANMVHVCSKCNSKKSNLTLAGFIRKYGLDRDAIEARLLKLYKDF